MVCTEISNWILGIRSILHTLVEFVMDGTNTIGIIDLYIL